jgi:hypothetical protein
MSGFFRPVSALGTMAGGLTVSGWAMAAVLVQLPRAIRPVKFMTLARDARQGHGHNQQGESFHRAA